MCCGWYICRNLDKDTWFVSVKDPLNRKQTRNTARIPKNSATFLGIFLALNVILVLTKFLNPSVKLVQIQKVKRKVFLNEGWIVQLHKNVVQALFISAHHQNQTINGICLCLHPCHTLPGQWFVRCWGGKTWYLDSIILQWVTCTTFYSIASYSWTAFFKKFPH